MSNAFSDRLFAAIQHILPQHFLSGIVYKITRIRWKPFKDALIRFIIKTYKVDMTLASEENPQNYLSFNHFFTRELKQTSRPVDLTPNSIVSPVDGAISQFGHIRQDKLFQAKGHDFSLLELLGGNEQWSNQFQNGLFNTIYLSPKDYHRIHCPIDAVLKTSIFIPGRLFSVNAATARTVPGLFSRNERLVNIFETDIGHMAVIFVGAIFVSSMETVWSGTVTSNQTAQAANPVSLKKGDEMGRFNMGSTVILLFEENAIQWEKWLNAELTLQMGQKIASSVTK